LKQLGNLRVYELKEVSDSMEIPESTLRTKLNRGIIRGQKLGNKWFVTEEAMRDFFEGNPSPIKRYKKIAEDTPDKTESRRIKMSEVGKRNRRKKTTEPPLTVEERAESEDNWQAYIRGEGMTLDQLEKEITDEK